MPGPDRWSPAQKEHRDRLIVAIDRGPWWMIVAPPCPPTFCMARATPIMRWDHTTWRSAFPPCRDGCVCTVWALRPEEARKFELQRGKPYGVL